MTHVIMTHYLISWTIRLALLCMVTALGLRILGWHQVPADSQERGQRWRPDRLHHVVWTAGFLLFLAHVASAFQFQHHWSHAVAIEDTRKQTYALLGIEFGAGLYFNYLFLLAWGVDCACCWCPCEPASKNLRLLRTTCVLFMLFIAFNGTVVFKSGWLRVISLMATVGLLLLWAIRTTLRRDDDSGKFGTDSI